ncbi:MAG TPA: hypothetical protein VEA16_14570 [Vicinamibacterales bacterium]|nr:hypothetical protein [Vicinamibacterales bacterium]
MTAIRLAVSFLLVAFGTSRCASNRLTDTEVARQFDALRPNEIMKLGHELLPALPRTMADQFVNQVKANHQGQVVKAEGAATFTYVAGTTKLSLSYQARTPGAESGVVTEGRIHAYFHRDGLVTVQSTCDVPPLNCAAMTELLQAAETALLPGIQTGGVDGILPEGGECATEVAQGINFVACTYQNGHAAMALTRVDVAAARAALGALELAGKRQFIEHAMAATK